MVLKNHILIKKKLTLVGLVLCCFSCKDTFHLNKIEGSRLEINSQIKEDSLITNFIEPYRLNVNKNLDSVLAFSVDTYSKNDGELNTAIGNLMADAVFKEANIKCNIYTSPHIKNINERFVFNNQELNDEELANLFEEIESANNNEPITFFDILTAAYFLKASQYPNNINLIETGLFHRFDATNILKNNLASIVTSIGLDHLDWLPENEQTVEKIIYEKTSTLLNSNIIVAKQSSKKITEFIKKTISNNSSKKGSLD